MCLTAFNTVINNIPLNLSFSGSDTFVLDSEYTDAIFLSIESVLAHEMTGYYGTKDINYGANASIYSMVALSNPSVAFRMGSFSSDRGIIRTTGLIPKFHCIRGIYNHYFRSFCYGVGDSFLPISQSLVDDFYLLSKPQLFRIQNALSYIFGYNVIELADKDIDYVILESSDYSLESIKFIILLLMELSLDVNTSSSIVMLDYLDDCSLDINIKLYKSLKLLMKDGILLIKASSDNAKNLANNGFNIITV